LHQPLSSVPKFFGRRTWRAQQTVFQFAVTVKDQDIGKITRRQITRVRKGDGSQDNVAFRILFNC
jgi:hypothetical protein